MTSHLTPQQQEAVKEIFTLADQRKAAADSKKIEQSGGKYFLYNFYMKQISNIIYFIIGYSFPSQTVPTSFNFGSTG